MVFFLILALICALSMVLYLFVQNRTLKEDHAWVKKENIRLSQHIDRLQDDLDEVEQEKAEALFWCDRYERELSDAHGSLEMVLNHNEEKK